MCRPCIYIFSAVQWQVKFRCRWESVWQTCWDLTDVVRCGSPTAWCWSSWPTTPGCASVSPWGLGLDTSSLAGRRLWSWMLELIIVIEIKLEVSLLGWKLVLSISDLLRWIWYMSSSNLYFYIFIPIIMSVFRKLRYSLLDIYISLSISVWYCKDKIKLQL